ncbi:hypothetical protein N9Z27_01720 [Alphaproteobacteria bacterium]|nr:hypothetical protein [Alphaproteobacteria bacterium]
MSFSLIKYVLTAALRDKLIISLLITMAVASSLSVFMGSAAIVEKDQFSLIFAGGGVRLAGVFGLILFVVFFIRRSFEARDIDFLLSRPVGRVEFLISYSAAFSILAIATGLVQLLCLYILGPHLFGEGTILWGFSLIIENIIMVNVALFFGMYFSSAASASMAVLALYVLGRMMGQILGILQTGGKASIFEGLEMAMNMVSTVTPRLDLMGQTSWLLYGTEGDVGYLFLILQGVLFCSLLLGASLIDLVKKQF